MRLALAAILVASSYGAADDTPTPLERKAIDSVVKAGGKAQIDPKLGPEARIAARFDSVSDTTLFALKKEPLIGAIEVIDATRCTEKGLAALKDLPNLRKLVLGKSNLKAAGASAIGQCPELRYLGLADSGLTDLDLANLKKLTRLEHLALSNNPRITDKGMQTVKGFERLRALYLANTALTDKGLVELKVLDGLRTLNVANTKVTADAAEQLVDEMPNLRGIRR